MTAHAPRCPCARCRLDRRLAIRQAAIRRVGLVLLALALAAFVAVPLMAAEPPAPNVSDIVRVIGDGPMAHACPLVGGLLVTNAHVVPTHPHDDRAAIVRWSDGSGNEGLAERVAFVAGADLAVLRVLGTARPAGAYAIATARPEAGVRVFVRGYRYDNRHKAMAERLVEAKVTRTEAGHLFFTHAGEPGSSGSCVLLWNDSSARWEATAVNRGGIRTEASDSETAGYAVGLWGQWGKLP